MVSAECYENLSNDVVKKSPARGWRDEQPLESGNTRRTVNTDNFDE